MNTENKTTQTPSAAADKTSHTPGPWQTEIATESIIFGERTLRVAICESSTRIAIARTTDLYEAPITEANARLIAAAPEMLNMLRVLSAVFNHSNFTDLGGYGQSIDRIIEKVEGKQ